MRSIKKMSVAVLLVLLSATQLTGCGKSKEQEAAEAAAARMAEAAKKMEALAQARKSSPPQTPQEAIKQGADAMAAAGAMMGAMAGGDGKGVVEPVDFRELKALLPEAIAGLKRGEASGEKTAAMGMKVSQVQARYAGDANQRIRLKIIDTGSMSGFAGMAAAGWAMVEIDRETDRGYERTSTVDGRKMHEKWNAKDKRGEVDVIVGGRFVVEIRGNGIDMKDLKQSLSAIDLKKLETMKGAPSAASASK